METNVQQTDALHRNYQRNIFLLSLLAFLVSAGWLFFVFYPTPVAGPLFAYTGVEMHGPTDLCPGDTLAYDLGLRYNDSGVFSIDIAVWRVSPPSTVVFSVSQRTVMTAPKTMMLAQRWVIPDAVFNPKTGVMEPMTPGKYERRHAVTTVSRATKPAIVAVPFTVKEDCE